MRIIVADPDKHYRSIIVERFKGHEIFQTGRVAEFWNALALGVDLVIVSRTLQNKNMLLGLAELPHKLPPVVIMSGHSYITMLNTEELSALDRIGGVFYSKHSYDPDAIVAAATMALNRRTKSNPPRTNVKFIKSYQALDWDKNPIVGEIYHVKRKGTILPGKPTPRSMGGYYALHDGMWFYLGKSKKDVDNFLPQVEV